MPATRRTGRRLRTREVRPPLAIIGAGRTGCGLAVALSRHGWTIAAVASRRTAPARRLARHCGASLATKDAATAAAESDAVLIAVPDREIFSVARVLSGLGTTQRARIVLHTSGVRDAAALSPLKRRGWITGSLHPLMTFPRPGSEPPDLTGVTFAIDGDRAALKLARSLARSLGGRSFVLPGRRRAGYHLAACLASNYVVALAGEATELLVRAGLTRRGALAALLPLLRGTVDNLETLGLPEALTGPVARGDDETLRRHAAVLRSGPPGTRTLHRHLVRSASRLALRAGRLDAAAIRRIERALWSRVPH